MIAYAMIYALAVGLPTLLAALLGSNVLRKQGKAERGVWLAALALALTLPLAALVGRGEEAVTEPVPVMETGLIGLPAVVAVPAVPTVPVPVARSARLDLGEILIGLWLFASLTLAVRWAVAARRLAKLTRSCPSTTVDGFRVWLTSKLGPAVAGVFRPRILAPRWLLSMPDRQRYLVLAHEREHIRAGDPWLFVASRVARILAPWNPFVWVLSSRLERAIELDCDRRVLRRDPDIEAYGLTLLTVSTRDPSRLLGAAAFAESEAPLRRRILAMTTPPGTVSVVGILTALVLGALLIVGAFEVPIPTFRTEVEPEATVWDPASSGTVAGLVRDATSGRPLEHIQIWMPCTGLGTLSSGDGRFLLTGVPAGEHRVIAERIGYREIAQTVTVSDGETATLELGLAETAIAVPGTVVTGGGDVRIARTRALDLVDSSRDSFDESPECVIRESDLPGRPIFTPFSVTPRVVNDEEVQRAVVEAYPPELREQGIGGTVQVYLFIDEEGEVQDYRLDESSGHRALDDAVLSVAGVYRFSPALNRDTPHAVWVSFPITFVGGEPGVISPGADEFELQVTLDELANARAELRALQERYSDEYPPIQELRDRIRKMEESVPGGVRDG